MARRTLSAYDRKSGMYKGRTEISQVETGRGQKNGKPKSKRTADKALGIAIPVGGKDGENGDVRIRKDVG